MVRVKAKKQKGDEAFTKRTQKVGRKKLAPVTATRAEVHARTLHLSTSASMIAATKAVTELTTAASAKAPENAGDREGGRKRLPVVAAHSLAELLAATHHYKTAQRTSAFHSMGRLLTMQAEKDAERRKAGNAFAGFLAIPALTKGVAAADDKKRKEGEAVPAAGAMTGVSALDKLKIFTAALEALTDTEDEVRIGALHCLKLLFQQRWLSDHDEEEDLAGAGAAAVVSIADVESRWAQQFQASASATSTSAVVVPSVNARREEKRGSVAQQDRMKAVMQAVHITLTHAMKSVRVSGVELTSLMLRHATPAAIRLATRAVCRQQYSLTSVDTSALGGSSGVVFGESGGGPVSTTATATNNNRTFSMARGLRNAGETGASAFTVCSDTRQSHVEEEESWMLSMARRVSALVLRSKQANVLPDLLAAFLMVPAGEPDAEEGDGGAAASFQGSAQGTGGSSSSTPAASFTSGGVQRASRSWQHPELVQKYMEDVLPQWANAWKECMELQLGLLRQEEKLAVAVSLARAFAVVLQFLKERQQRAMPRGPHCHNQPRHPSSSTNAIFLTRTRQQYMKELFIYRVPVTMGEVLRIHVSGSHGNSSSHNNSNGENRMELALALARVSTPIAGTDEGWKVLHQYFSTVFPKESSIEGKQHFQFPNPRALLKSVEAFLTVLHMFPCSIAAVSEFDTTAAAAASSFSSSLVASINAGGSSSEGERAFPSTPSNTSTQQHPARVFEKMIPFAPALMQAVIKFVSASAARGNENNSNINKRRRRTATAADTEDALLASVLLTTCGIVSRLALFPLSDAQPPLLRNSLASVFTAVPRLLFALRLMYEEQKPAVESSSEDTESSAEEDKQEEEEEEEEEEQQQQKQQAKNKGKDTSVSAVVHATAAPMMTVTTAGIFLSHPALVDMVVYHFLRVLWFLVSSGHPLFAASLATFETSETSLAQTSSGDGATTTSSSSVSSLRNKLKASVLALFGVALPSSPKVLEGVLVRCSPHTVELARHLLLYLGVRDAVKMVVLRSPLAVGLVSGASVAAATSMEENTAEVEKLRRRLDAILLVLPCSASQAITAQ